MVRAMELFGKSWRRWVSCGVVVMDLEWPGWTWCRRDGRGAAGMDVASSWRPCGRPETLRAVQNRGEVGRDVARTGETCRGRERRAEDGRDVPRTGETCRGRERRAEDGRDVPRTGETCRGRERRAEDERDVARSTA